MRNKQENAISAQAGITPKGNSTRQALVEEALRLISQNGIESVSVLSVTRNLGVSNGVFYYHFKNKDQLLEEVGQAIVLNLVADIHSAKRKDPAAQVARGPLIILRYVARHPEQRQIMLRVIEDPEGHHANLEDELRNDIRRGKRGRRFAVSDVGLAVSFCRAIVASALRSASHGRPNNALKVETAVHTLTMLGISRAEAEQVVALELKMLDAS